MKYGFVPLMSEPAVLEEEVIRVYYKMLPYLGVNRNLRADWRWLPTKFQGLGLPNLSIEKLAMMLQYVVRHWDMGEGIWMQMRRVMEIAQIECGLEGNFLTRPYNMLESLMSPCWPKLLWSYVDYFGVTLEVDDLLVPPV